MLERLFQKSSFCCLKWSFFGGKSSFWIQTVLLKPELPADIYLTSKQRLYKTQNFVKTTFNDMQFNHIFTAKTKHCEIDLVMAMERVKKCFHGTYMKAYFCISNEYQMQKFQPKNQTLKKLIIC